MYELFLIASGWFCYSQDASKFESKSPPRTMELAKTSNLTMVDDLLFPPGRQNRPPKIAIILRGPPGSGKSFVAKLIKVNLIKLFEFTLDSICFLVFGDIWKKIKRKLKGVVIGGENRGSARNRVYSNI